MVIHNAASESVEEPFGWVVVVASVMAITVGGAAYYIPIVSLKLIAAEFDWPRAIPALGFSLTIFGSGIGGVYMGRWSDRVGMAPPLVFGTLMIALGCVLSSYATGIWTFLIAQGLFIGLLGNGALYGPLVANVTRWFDRRRGLAVGMVATGQTLAGAFWSPVFRVMAEWYGWRLTFVYYGAFMVVTMLPIALIVREFFSSTGLGQRMGVVILFGTIGMALGSWMAGYIHDQTGGYAQAFVVGSAFNVVNILIVAYLVWRRRQVAATLALA